MRLCDLYSSANHRWTNMPYMTVNTLSIATGVGDVNEYIHPSPPPWTSKPFLVRYCLVFNADWLIYVDAVWPYFVVRWPIYIQIYKNTTRQLIFIIIYLIKLRKMRKFVLTLPFKSVTLSSLSTSWSRPLLSDTVIWNPHTARLIQSCLRM